MFRHYFVNFYLKIRPFFAKKALKMVFFSQKTQGRSPVSHFLGVFSLFYEKWVFSKNSENWGYEKRIPWEIRKMEKRGFLGPPKMPFDPPNSPLFDRPPPGSQKMGVFGKCWYYVQTILRLGHFFFPSCFGGGFYPPKRA